MLYFWGRCQDNNFILFSPISGVFIHNHCYDPSFSKIGIIMKKANFYRFLNHNFGPSLQITKLQSIIVKLCSVENSNIHRYTYYY
jgi:hypothetical protein